MPDSKPIFAATDLFDPVELGPYRLANRIVMAPLTRARARGADVPSPLAAEYYAQRASAGLIVAEATQISPQGKGYAGPKELAAVFMVGKFDHFAEKPHAEKSEKSEKSDAEKPSSDKANDPCAGAAYTPFPELEKLPR